MEIIIPEKKKIVTFEEVLSERLTYSVSLTLQMHSWASAGKASLLRAACNTKSQVSIIIIKP